MSEDKKTQVKDFSIIENFIVALNIEYEESKKIILKNK